MITIYDSAHVHGENSPGNKTSSSRHSCWETDVGVSSRAKPLLPNILVNGVRIEEADILAEAQNHAASNSGDALMEAARALTISELLWQEAQRKKLKPDPVVDENGRTETPKDAAIRGLIEQEVGTPRANDKECRRYYDRNPQRYMSQTISEARHILIPANCNDPQSRDSARKQANELIALLHEQPSKFSAFAKKFSACQSSRHGGNLGQLTRGSTVPEFERAIELMEVGSISASPVESRYGFHIIALDRKTPGKILPYEMVRERLMAWLEASSWSKAASQYIAILAERADIQGIELRNGKSQLP